MKKFIYILLSVLWLASCQKPSDTATATLTDDQLAAIMADVAIAEGATAMVAGYKKDSLNTAYYNMVLQIHHVSLEEYERNLRVAVQDNGSGVPPEQQALIFEKFRQGGDAAFRPQGTGLGLPISRQIIEHFGGRLWIDDTAEGGARFVFELPRPRQGTHP